MLEFRAAGCVQCPVETLSRMSGTCMCTTPPSLCLQAFHAAQRSLSHDHLLQPCAMHMELFRKAGR